MKVSIRCLLMAGIVTFSGLLTSAQTPKKWQTFNYGQRTYATGINKSGQVTGTWVGNGGCYAFIRNPDGSVTTEAATCYGMAINDQGEIVGNLWKTTNAYLRMPDGTIQTWQGQSGMQIAASAVNAAGYVAGWTGFNSYGETNTLYVNDPNGNLVGSYDFPHDPDYPYSMVSVTVGSINNLNQVSGWWQAYVNHIQVEHGFIYDLASNTITQLDVPGAEYTQALVMNDAGEVAGNYIDSGPCIGNGCAFTWKPKTGYKVYPTGAIAGINSTGTVVGQGGFTIGPKGRITKFSIPGTTTICTGINDAGQVTGYYYVKPNNLKGFVYTPPAPK